MIRIKKGLDLPISGEPQQVVLHQPQVSQVALLGEDYHGMKPTMKVKVGDFVKMGQELFEDKKNAGVIYTSPASGTVKAINRGDKRVFNSIEIAVSGNDEITFDEAMSAKGDLQKTQDSLVRSGLWTALKTRPFSKVPALGTRPKCLFVNGMDTNPLAANPAVIIEKYRDDFYNGLEVLSVFNASI